MDSEDVPLNINRETIQTNRIIIKIENLIVKRFFRDLNKLASFLKILQNTQAPQFIIVGHLIVCHGVAYYSISSSTMAR